jgi:HlyD family secretion protein
VRVTSERIERIDTRVLEVIYSFDPDDKPVFIGQQVDVFIKAQ